MFLFLSDIQIHDCVILNPKYRFLISYSTNTGTLFTPLTQEYFI